jgi:uncharacterized membrane protein (DUF4010 family)
VTDTLGGAAVSLLIGLLLGLERQRSQRSDEQLFAGIRTFPVLVLAGYLGGLAAASGAPLALPAVLLGVAALVVAAYLRTAGEHVGATTEALALLAPLLGATVGFGRSELAAAVAVAVTLLLTLKAPLRKIAHTVSEDEIFSILKFGIVAVILLPLLPERPYGPYDAIVPRHVGFVVVTISAVSLVGYLAVRVLGGRAGWALTGLVGGLVSSTAVTLTFAGKAREAQSLLRPLAAGTLLASMILYARGAVLIGLFDPPTLGYLAPRLLALFAVGAAFAFREWRTSGTGETGSVGLGNPVELTKAFSLGLLFALILLLGRAAQARFGSAGLWAAAAVGGLLDVDSVALANARLRQQGLASIEAAGGSFLLATLANLVVKGGIVVTAGGTAFARRVLPAFLALSAATVVALAV